MRSVPQSQTVDEKLLRKLKTRHFVVCAFLRNCCNIIRRCFASVTRDQGMQATDSQRHSAVESCFKSILIESFT
jgi:hypothetical protein